jgi:hypothetical protein
MPANMLTTTAVRLSPPSADQQPRTASSRCGERTSIGALPAGEVATVPSPLLRLLWRGIHV